MGAIRTILHPTALSRKDREAARLAGTLARAHGARLVILHVMCPWYWQGRAEMLAPYLRQKIERWEALRHYPIGDAGQRRELRLSEGEPVAAVLRTARSLPADLIVMRHDERSRMRQWLGGGLTDAILHKAPCPVLTVRASPGKPCNRDEGHPPASEACEDTPASRSPSAIRSDRGRSELMGWGRFSHRLGRHRAVCAGGQ